MNMHPFVVHFPIALLSMYALMEFLAMSSLGKKSWWKPTKLSFLFPGILGAFFGLITGNIISEKIDSVQNLIETHEFFAWITTWIFGIIAVFYLVDLFDNKLRLNKYISMVMKIKDFFLNRYFIALLAIIGFVSLMITGALGGAIVRGPDVDIFVRIIYDLVM
ncbi:MAG: hypothetical protein Q8Q42_02890 [Nanoarchaeota archaeon]|nr:hypothetical protein [Nanoarchaeota archaeon]